MENGTGAVLWFAFVGFKSISKRLAQPDNTQKSAETVNPIEEWYRDYSRGVRA